MSVQPQGSIDLVTPSAPKVEPINPPIYSFDQPPPPITEELRLAPARAVS